MAGLIAALKLRKREPDPYDPHLAGRGGVTGGPGPYGADGFPGSTSATRVNNGKSPRDVLIRSDSDVGFDQGFEGDQTRMAGRHYGEGWDNPRETAEVTTPQPRTVGSLRRNASEWFGGVPLRSDGVAPAVHTAGGNPLMPSAAAGGHSTYDTETPRISRQPDISGGVPGSENVRNTIALKYQNPPAQMHTYNSASRHDQGDTGPAESGSGGGRRGVTTEVTVPNRFKWDGPGGGAQTWSVQRQMPYNGRGDGARGADLNGTRYYAEGPPVAVNAGMGSFGIARLRGDKTRRPVSFTEPAPWTGQFYDTTASVGTADAPGQPGQVPQNIHVSPEPGRGGMNATGR